MALMRKGAKGGKNEELESKKKRQDKDKETDADKDKGTDADKYKGTNADKNKGADADKNKGTDADKVQDNAQRMSQMRRTRAQMGTRVRVEKNRLLNMCARLVDKWFFKRSRGH